ncbi:unnamed protein product [Periconia digitata]|uniref:Uncharacterized protein n=1 Tax=Periconia digitata TaxID=1303443 RepID=A0A9W4UN76_9PLEO|nr:unnamed protein product [Periconia digitata]
MMRHSRFVSQFCGFSSSYRAFECTRLSVSLVPFDGDRSSRVYSSSLFEICSSGWSPTSSFSHRVEFPSLFSNAYSLIV